MLISENRIHELIKEELNHLLNESAINTFKNDTIDGVADKMWNDYWIPAKPIVKIARGLGLTDSVNLRDKKQLSELASKLFEIQKRGIGRIKESSDWEKNFKWAKQDDLKVIQFLIGMSHGGVGDVVKDMKKNPSAFKSFVKDLAKQGLYEGFAGTVKGEKQKHFERLRKQSAEVLGYTLTGTSDIKTEIGDATLKETADVPVNVPEKGSSYKTHFSEDDEEAEKVDENRVRISTMKDAEFTSNGVLLLGKKGRVGMDRKSISALVKAVRKTLGRSFTTHEVKEEKLTESTALTLPNGIKAKIEFKGITLQQTGKKPVFLDRAEMMRFFKATAKYMKIKNEGNIGITTKKGKSIELTHKTSGKEIVVQNTPSVLEKYKKLGYLISMPEGKITEDYKNSEWEVYVKDENGREKIVKKAKSKRAATILYNRIIKSDDYYEVGMKVVKEAKLTEGVADEIRKQIPRRTLSYVGAKNFAKGKSPKGEFLEFSVRGSRLKTGGKIKVIYSKSGDDYTIEAWQIRGTNVKLVKKQERIQVDKLARTIENLVG
jgi:hypothetical protein